MKNYAVTITHPASADVDIEARSKAEAINKVKSMLGVGAQIDFEVEIDNPDAPNFFAVELTGDGKPAEEVVPSGLKEYTVMLEAKSYKEVPLKAVSAETAMQLAHEMYFRTDALDFNDGDVESIVATVIEGADKEAVEEPGESDESAMLDPLLRLVRAIRDCDGPDETVAAILKDGLDAIYGVDD